MLQKAKLVEVRWNGSEARSVNGRNDIEVQFNPQTLRLTYSNENRSGNQPGGSARQFIGSGVTKLTVELLFDTTQSGSDVRWWTAKIGYFIRAEQPRGARGNTRTPPGVSFEWGTFKLAGVVDSLQETLDYFAEDGTPLRATVSLGITRQDIVFPTDAAGRPEDSGRGRPGTAPLNTVRSGDSLPQAAGREGRSSDWKAIAAANNVDNPLRLQAGSLLNLNPAAGAGSSAGGGLGAGIGAGGGLSAGGGVGGQVGFSAGLGGGVGFSTGAGGGFGASAGTGGGFGASAGVGGGFGASASAGGTGGASGSAGFTGAAGASAGFGR